MGALLGSGQLMRYSWTKVPSVMLRQCRTCLILGGFFFEVHRITGLRATGVGHERNFRQIEAPPAVNTHTFVQKPSHPSDGEQKVLLALIVVSLVVLTICVFHPRCMRALEENVP